MTSHYLSPRGRGGEGGSEVFFGGDHLTFRRTEQGIIRK